MNTSIDVEFRVYVLVSFPDGQIWMSCSEPFGVLDMAESAMHAEQSERPYALFRIVRTTTAVTEEVI